MVYHRQIRGHGTNRLWRPVACDHPTLTRLVDHRCQVPNYIEEEVMISELLAQVDPITRALAVRLLLYGDTQAEAGQAVGIGRTAVQKRLGRWSHRLQEHRKQEDPARAAPVPHAAP